MKTALNVEHLSHRYGRARVLTQVSFNIRQGVFCIVIGPNGSGKTTLMKIISGTEKAGTGQVALLDRPLAEYSRKDLARTIAFVPQTMTVDFPFTVREIVLMGRSPHQGALGLERGKDLAVTAEAMAFTGVEHLADRKIDQLSGGEQQRVFIARAICQNPRIIMLDEPTAALDLAHQIRIMDLMEQLKNEKGVTVIMVSHDVNLAAMYGDHLLLLKDGEILTQGSPEAVLTYASLEKAYGCLLIVDESPLGKFPRVTPVPRKLKLAR